MTEIRPFECGIKVTDHTRVIYALTRSKARYQYLLDASDAWEGLSFSDITVRPCGTPKTPQSFAKTAEYRGVPFARIGMSVEVGGEPGIIVGNNSSANFDVIFTDGKNKGQTMNCHPNWMIKYFDSEGKVIKEFGA